MFIEQTIVLMYSRVWVACATSTRPTVESSKLGGHTRELHKHHYSNWFDRFSFRCLMTVKVGFLCGWVVRLYVKDSCLFLGVGEEVSEYLDIPGGPGGGVGAPQGPRDTPRASHVDWREAASHALPPLRAHAASLLQPTCVPILSDKSNHIAMWSYKTLTTKPIAGYTL